MNREINSIYVHCSDTPPSMDIGLDEIKRWHVKERGFKDVGYHAIIRRDGTIQSGRPLKTAGAHAKGHNLNSIGICLIGGRHENGSPDVNYTPAQWRSLEGLVENYLLVYNLDSSDVFGHRDVAAKACPCFDARAWARGL